MPQCSGGLPSGQTKRTAASLENNRKNGLGDEETDKLEHTKKI